MDTRKLDNPIYYSLAETHKDFSINYKGLKFYHPDYLAFGAFEIPHNTRIEVENPPVLMNDFFVAGEKPKYNEKLLLKNEVVCNQMILEKPIKIEITDKITELRTRKQKEELAALVNFVQPGYYKTMTSEMGTYYGIYKGNKLIAVSGERMKMDKFTEVSSVITHPDHTRKGYAKQLAAHTCNKIFEEGKTPYLHVVSINTGAINLYEKLGFKTRRIISFWNFNANLNEQVDASISKYEENGSGIARTKLNESLLIKLKNSA